MTARTFVDDARTSGANFGIENLPLAIMPAPLTNQSQSTLKEMVDGSWSQLIDGLTKSVSQHARIDTQDDGGGDLSQKEFGSTFERKLSEGVDVNELFLAHGLTDGLPIVVPTRARVDAMLGGTTRDPADVVAVLEPGFGIATVEKIAINAVMAGCAPAEIRILIAAVEALAEPKMFIRNKGMSTGIHAPMVVVGGPIADELGLNNGVCALGPSTRSVVNIRIGRALRLCMINIGHMYPSVGDMDTIGSPAKFGMVLSESERNDWRTIGEEYGFRRTDNTVTVHFSYGHCDLYDPLNTDPDRVAQVFATAALNVSALSTGLWLIGRRADTRYGTDEQEHHLLVISPDQAKVFQESGWSKKDLQQALYKYARLPFARLIMNKNRAAMDIAHPELNWLWDSPDTLVPVVEGPECFEIVISGGAVARGLFMWGAGEPVTRAVGN